MDVKTAPNEIKMLWDKWALGEKKALRLKCLLYNQHYKSGGLDCGKKFRHDRMVENLKEDQIRMKPQMRGIGTE